MQALATVAEAIGGTTKKTEKVRLLAEYFRSRTVEESAVSAVFLSGRAFPGWEEATLQVGGAQLWRVVGALAHKSEAVLTAAYRRHGDLGAAAYEVLR
ncbi:MAG: ATP-dependent DNA ligase, partial [Terriglobales bacterium]